MSWSKVSTWQLTKVKVIPCHEKGCVWHVAWSWTITLINRVRWNYLMLRVLVLLCNSFMCTILQFKFDDSTNVTVNRSRPQNCTWRSIRMDLVSRLWVQDLRLLLVVQRCVLQLATLNVPFLYWNYCYLFSRLFPIVCHISLLITLIWKVQVWLASFHLILDWLTNHKICENYGGFF